MASSALPMPELPGFWLGGNSWNDCRNWPTIPRAGMNAHVPHAPRCLEGRARRLPEVQPGPDQEEVNPILTTSIPAVEESP
jgi:hypothetical protein